MNPRGLWEPEQPDLAAVAAEVSETFRVERALLSANIAERVLAHLPRQATALVRTARMLTGAILLGSLGVLALLLQLVAARAPFGDPYTLVRVMTGAGALVVAMLVSLATPRLLLFESRILTRLIGRAVRPRPLDLVLARVGALLVLAAGGLILL